MTLAGFHSLNAGMFELARDYSRTGMTAYARLQEREFALADSDGYSAIRHQTFVGHRLLRRRAEHDHVGADGDGRAGRIDGGGAVRPDPAAEGQRRGGAYVSRTGPPS